MKAKKNLYPVRNGVSKGSQPLVHRNLVCSFVKLSPTGDQLQVRQNKIGSSNRTELTLLSVVSVSISLSLSLYKRKHFL
jgi:hypothetical protein